MLLFQFCPYCKIYNPLVETSQNGTKVIVYTHCGNPDCKQKDSVWRSQPNMEGTKIPAGNFLLSFTTLVAGASISKVQRVFNRMGLACISLTTFFQHQKVSWSNTIISIEHTFILSPFPITPIPKSITPFLMYYKFSKSTQNVYTTFLSDKFLLSSLLTQRRRFFDSASFALLDTLLCISPFLFSITLSLRSHS